MPANDSTLDLKKLREMLKAIPPVPEVLWTHLLTGSKAYTNGDRSYISLDAVREFECAPARPDAGMPAFYAINILCAEDVAREAMGFSASQRGSEKSQSVLRDLLTIANTEYGDKAGAALQSAFYRAPEKKEETND